MAQTSLETIGLVSQLGKKANV